jgi:hypothetical protein
MNPDCSGLVIPQLIVDICIWFCGFTVGWNWAKKNKGKDENHL